jgi:hypothetical protein
MISSMVNDTVGAKSALMFIPALPLRQSFELVNCEGLSSDVGPPRSLLLVTLAASHTSSADVTGGGRYSFRNPSFNARLDGDASGRARRRRRRVAQDQAHWQHASRGR